VRHREFLTDVSGTVAFAGSDFYLNPGLSATFPWLSSIAKNYEQYRFHGLLFEFKSTSATAVSSTNTALGTVVLVTDFDDLDLSYTTKQEMEAAVGCVSTVPSRSVIHPVECAPRQTPIDKLWVRSVEYSDYATVDPRLFDLGRFTIATSGMQAASTIGELWVSYDVEFFKPQLNTSNDDDISLQWGHLTGSYSASVTAGVVPSNTTHDATSTFVPLLTNAFLSGYQTVRMSFAPIGRYIITVAYSAATSVSGLAGNVPTLVNASYVANEMTGISTARTAGSGTATATQTFVIDTLISGSVDITWPSSVTTVGAATFDMLISRLPSTATLEKLGCGETKASRVIKALEEKLRHRLAAVSLSEEKGLALERDLDRGPLAMTSSGRLCTHVDEAWTEVGVRGNTLDCGLRRCVAPGETG